MNIPFRNFNLTISDELISKYEKTVGSVSEKLDWCFNTVFSIDFGESKETLEVLLQEYLLEEIEAKEQEDKDVQSYTIIPNYTINFPKKIIDLYKEYQLGSIVQNSKYALSAAYHTEDFSNLFNTYSKENLYAVIKAYIVAELTEYGVSVNDL